MGAPETAAVARWAHGAGAPFCGPTEAKAWMNFGPFFVKLTAEDTQKVIRGDQAELTRGIDELRDGVKVKLKELNRLGGRLGCPRVPLLPSWRCWRAWHPLHRGRRHHACVKAPPLSQLSRAHPDAAAQAHHG